MSHNESRRARRVKRSHEHNKPVARRHTSHFDGLVFQSVLWRCYFDRDANPSHTLNEKTALIARFMGPTWGLSGADRTQVGPMLAPRTLLSGWLTNLCPSDVHTVGILSVLEYVIAACFRKVWVFFWKGLFWVSNVLTHNGNLIIVKGDVISRRKQQTKHTVRI